VCVDGEKGRGGGCMTCAKASATPHAWIVRCDEGTGLRGRREERQGEREGGRQGLHI
jgi:hypothetical protein